MGARVGYSWLNGLVMGILCLTGTLGVITYLIPVDAGMAIVLWIGIVIVAQSFTATPAAHAPAVVMGLLPGIAAWGALIAKNSMRVAGMGIPEQPFEPEVIVAGFKLSDNFIEGAFSLEQGVILSAMILSAITVYIIEQKFGLAALWALSAALLSGVGLIHSFAWTPTDTVVELGWGAGAEWAISYFLLAILFVFAAWLNKRKQAT